MLANILFLVDQSPIRPLDDVAAVNGEPAKNTLVAGAD
jgi:hypothetical protein